MEWHPTCCGIFRVHFERRRTQIMTANKGILKKNSRHFNISNVCIIQTVCVRLTIHVTPRVLVLMAIGGVIRLQRIYNFLLLHAIIYSVLDV